MLYQLSYVRALPILTAELRPNTDGPGSQNELGGRQWPPPRSHGLDAQTAGSPMRLRTTSRAPSAANDIRTRPLAAQMPALPQLNVLDVSYTAGVEVLTMAVLAVVDGEEPPTLTAGA